VAKPAKTAPPTTFAVLTKADGSYTFGDHKVSAGQVTPLPAEAEALTCPDSSPVKFFETKAVADEFLSQLRIEFAQRSKG
jgi:hypothetical protein